MRKVLTLALMLLSGMVVCAQYEGVVDSLAVDSAYNNDTVEFFAPKKNPIYYFGSPFCEHFCELRYTSGPDGFGLGAMYTYLPEVWGFNVSAFMMDLDYYWLSGGAAYRLSKPWSDFDWHLYGNVGLSFDHAAIHQLRPTVEAGIRWSEAKGLGRFSLTSGTLGLMTNFDGVYITFGIGLTISSVLSFLLFLIP